ncbi:MAG TPA: HD domain-containing phosphohydrolase, partial [Acidobacteriota bacterium]
IPWTSELKQVPIIAYGHHEKLNGSGYPNRSSADNIPIQTRMMTISDIYDALTASDRPYKKAVPTQRALDILSSEVKSGQVDPNLFQIFLDAKIYLLSSRK